MTTTIKLENKIIGTDTLVVLAINKNVSDMCVHVSACVCDNIIVSLCIKTRCLMLLFSTHKQSISYAFVSVWKRQQDNFKVHACECKERDQKNPTGPILKN